MSVKGMKRLADDNLIPIKDVMVASYPCNEGGMLDMCVIGATSLDLDIHIYNVDSVPNQLSYFEQQQLDKILNDFCDVFSSELPHGLPPKCNIAIV